MLPWVLNFGKMGGGGGGVKIVNLLYINQNLLLKSCMLNMNFEAST